MNAPGTQTLLLSAWREWVKRCADLGQKPGAPLDFALDLLTEARSRGLTYDVMNNSILGLDLGLELESYDNAVNLADVEAKPIDWLWPQMLGLGKIHLLGGDPGQGKSQTCAFAAATITVGGPWPCDAGDSRVGSVLWWSEEEEVSTEIKPRLLAAGADIRKIRILPETFNLTQIKLLDREADILGDVRLLVIDPINSAMGGATTATAVRKVLNDLRLWADRRNIAILGILHPPKGKAATLSNLFSGSGGYRQYARVTLFACADPKDKDVHYLTIDKANIISDKRAHVYRIVGVQLTENMSAPRVVFEDEKIDFSASDIAVGKPDTSALAGEGAPDPRKEAACFDLLVSLIGPGEEKSGPDMKARLRAAGYSKGVIGRAMQRAIQDLNMTVEGEGGAPRIWRRP